MLVTSIHSRLYSSTTTYTARRESRWNAPLCCRRVEGRSSLAAVPMMSQILPQPIPPTQRRKRKRRRPISAMAISSNVVTVLLLMRHIVVVVFAWIPVSTRVSTRPPSLPTAPDDNTIRNGRSMLNPSILFANNNGSDDAGEGGNEDPLLSDLDARVLQSMLQDSANKLDLQQEENMKKLLERGIKSKQKVESPAVKDQERSESDYSSQVIKTLADTKLWKALSRNAADFFESATIAIANRVERDAKLVASLGIFALDRALQDVSRALPAAASFTQNKKKVSQLSDKSSFEPQKAKKEDKKVDLRKEFSTPQDEIKSVTAEIKQIFEQADQKVTPRSLSSAQKTLPSAASSLKSTARRGTARLSSAYQRQQKTKLAREKENIAQKAPRLASSVIDSAYQVKRELQIEPNQPGYKTKRLRAATASTAKLLASAAKAGGSLLLGQAQNKKGSNQLPFSSTTTPASSTAAQPSRKFDIVPPSSVSNGASTTSLQDTVMDATARAMDAAFFAIARNESPPTKVTADPVDFLDNEPYFAFKRGPTPATNEETTKTPLQLWNESQQSLQETTSYTETQPGFAVADASTTTKPNVINVEFQRSADGVITGIDPATIDAFQVVVDGGQGTPASADYFYTGYGYVEDATAMEDEDLESIRQVTAEVISEEDFESVFGKAKTVNNLGESEDDDEEEEKPPNLLVILTLRSLDVLFLVVEKTLLLVPDILVLTGRVATRVGEVNREGMGQIGWQPLNTKIRGSKRY